MLILCTYAKIIWQARLQLLGSGPQVCTLHLSKSNQLICSINQLLRCVAIYLVSTLKWCICYLLLGFDPLLKTCCCKNRHYNDWFSVFCPQLHSISAWGLTTPLKSYINMYIQFCSSHLCWTMHQVRCYDHNHKFIWIKTVNVNKHLLLNMSKFKNTQRKIQLNIQLGFVYEVFAICGSGCVKSLSPPS